MSKVVLDEISDFRRNWDEPALQKLYYGLTEARDRHAMRATYEHAVRRVQREPSLCKDAFDARLEKLKAIFGEDDERAATEYVAYR